MKECYPDKLRVARDILVYLSGRPDAQDTLNGIVRLQVQGQAGSGQPMLVKEVLADLVTQGRIRVVNDEGKSPYYRVHHDPGDRVRKSRDPASLKKGPFKN